MPQNWIARSRLCAVLVATAVLVAGAQEPTGPDLYRQSIDRAQALFAKNDYPAAIAAYEAARAVALRLNDHKQIATCDRGIGLAHYRQGHVAQALDAYQRGLAQAEASGDKAVLAELLRGVGVAQRASGNRTAALEAGTRSLALVRELGDLRSVAGMLGNLATLYIDAGDLRRAGELLTESLHVAEASHLDDMVRSAFDNLSTVYSMQGDLPIAIDYMERTLKLREAAGDESRIIFGVVNNLAITHLALGHYDEALGYSTRSLALARQGTDERRVATALLNRGSMLRRHGSNAEALDDLRQSQAIFDKNAIPAGTAETLTNIALVHLAMRENDTALAEGRRAAALARSIESPERVWPALEAVANASARLGLREDARTAFGEEVVTVEGMRRMLTGGEQQGEFFLADKMGGYRGLVKLDVEDGRLADALRIAEQAKARQLFDVLRSGHALITKTMTAEEASEERRLQSTAADVQAQIARAAGAEGSAALHTEWERAARALDTFRAGLYAAHPELRNQRAEPQPFSLSEAKALLPDTRTGLLEFMVGEDAVYAFLLTRGPDGQPSLAARTLAWRQSDLARDVEAFRDQLAIHDLGYRKLAASLYIRLLQPFAAELHGKTLVGIVPDDALWSLPFQALTAPSGRAVVEDHAVFYAPSLTTLRENRGMRRDRAIDRSRTLLAMGGPSLVGMNLNLPPLPESAHEARQLGKLYGAGASAVFTGSDAREDRWKEEAPRYRVLHLATHGVLNSANPLYSYLVLNRGAEPGSNGLLEARAILDLDLHADLTVLSACETARGRISAGEGVVGMSWAFLVAGSPTTVVSQWKVVAASTSRLMVAFHRHLIKGRSPGLTDKARALQAASLELLRSPAYRHPFYWAAFNMIGDGY